MREQEALLIVVIATFAASFLSYYLNLLSATSAGVAFVVLSLLVVDTFFFVDFRTRMNKMELSNTRNTETLSILVSSLIKLQSVSSKEHLTQKELMVAISDGISPLIDKISKDYFDTHHTSGFPPSVENRKQELLRKAQAKTITLIEGQELQQLLENQRKAHQSSGDLGGAILAGILILFIIGVLAALFGDKD